MTLVVALAGQNEIVIGADGISPIGDDDGQYRIESNKLRRVLKDQWVVGVSGSRAGYTLLKRADSGNPRELKDLSANMSDVYRREYSVELRLIFAGFENGHSSLYTWNGLGKNSVNGLILAEEGRAAVGLRKHGALHFMHAYHSIDMNASQLALLCHYCLSEAIRQDTRLGGPVNMAIVSRSSIIDLDEDKIKVLQDASTQIRSKIGKLFFLDAPFIYPSSAGARA